MSHIIKNQEVKKHEDRYNTATMSIQEKTKKYDEKIKSMKDMKAIHKTEISNLKALKISSQNVLQFKLDEMTKKMKNEIYRLSEEARRHEESQKNENNKIQNQINYIRENCEGLDKALKEILDRVISLEKTLGPLNL
jgi:hypothetical protein